MEKPPSLLCPVCGKLYDLQEIIPNCDHLYCASCFLKTKDRSCKICKAFNVKLLKKYDTIKISLKELESELECEDEDFIEKQIKRTQEICSKCSQSSEISMICVDCARIKLRRLENEEWIIQEVGGDVKVADDVICAECAVIDHGGHELVEVTGIQNLTDAIKNEFFLEYYHHRKSILQQFSPNIEKYKDRTDSFYGLLTKEYFVVNFESCSTELIDRYRQERKKLADAMMKVLKLIMRLKKMYIYCLEKHIDHQGILYEDAATNEQKEVIQRLLLRLSMTQIKFEEFIENYPQVQLTPEDIEEIDAELNDRMETLEANYKKGLLIEIKMENVSKFHKYQAILKEPVEINKCLNSTDIKVKGQLDFIKTCSEKINSIRGDYHDHQQDPEEAIKFYEMEIMQTIIRHDKKMKRSFEINERIFFRELMKLKFFPVTPEADAMDSVYNRFLF